jgi:hypothetical protein
MGLTPDWIISTAAFNVFQLPVRRAHAYAQHSVNAAALDNRGLLATVLIAGVCIQLPTIRHANPAFTLHFVIMYAPAFLALLSVLQRPTPEQPFIAGLLDPACNSKVGARMHWQRRMQRLCGAVVARASASLLTPLYVVTLAYGSPDQLFYATLVCCGAA